MILKIAKDPASGAGITAIYLSIGGLAENIHHNPISTFSHFHFSFHP
jgi:hypothetical protein